jgi:hypothetical protein
VTNPTTIYGSTLNLVFKEALDEGEQYNTILIDVKDVCILISINSAIGSLTT